MALLQPNDILFAHKALNIVPGLSANTRRVAGALIDHFNKKTGQCDPSIGRLAKLLGINRASVLRATEKLCEPEIGLFEKISHGGKSNRTKYLPRWEVFRGIVANWDARMKTGEAPAKVAKLRRKQSQNRDVKGCKIATQTLRRNQSNKPTEDWNMQNLPSNQGNRTIKANTNRAYKEKFGKSKAPISNAPFYSQKSPSHDAAAMAAAEKKIFSGIYDLGEKKSAEFIAFVTEPLMEKASRAEMRRRGDGLKFIQEEYNQARCTKAK